MRVQAPGTTPKAVWDYAVAAAIIAGTLGKLITDNIDAPISGAKADVSDMALASVWTAGLATILGNFSAARIASLDNIDASFKELFFAAFKFPVDDLPDAVATGTVATPEAAIDNNTGNQAWYSAVDQYVNIDLGDPCYVKRFRYYGSTNGDPGNRFKLQAFVAGIWVDALTDIVDIDALEWSNWLDLSAPQIAQAWRIILTTKVTDAYIKEAELEGVVLG